MLRWKDGILLALTETSYPLSLFATTRTGISRLRAIRSSPEPGCLPEGGQRRRRRPGIVLPVKPSPVAVTAATPSPPAQQPSTAAAGATARSMGMGAGLAGTHGAVTFSGTPAPRAQILFTAGRRRRACRTFFEPGLPWRVGNLWSIPAVLGRDYSPRPRWCGCFALIGEQ